MSGQLPYAELMRLANGHQISQAIHVAATLPANEHAVMVLDRAGWHTAKRLVIPSNVTLIWLPPYSPEINPVERVWLYLREKHWSHRLLDTYDAIVDALCRAWNALTAERLRSLTSYPYLQQVKI